MILNHDPKTERPSVICPFDKNHKMPAARLIWHLAKCKSKKKHEQDGKPVFHCRHNFLHIHFGQEENKACEAECGQKIAQKE